MQEHIGNELPNGKRLNDLRRDKREVLKEKARVSGLEDVSEYEDANVCY
jgi:hypothetical protein